MTVVRSVLDKNEIQLSRLHKVVKVSWSRVSGSRERKIAIAFFGQVSAAMEYVAALIILPATWLWKSQSKSLNLCMLLFELRISLCSPLWSTKPCKMTSCGYQSGLSMVLNLDIENYDAGIMESVGVKVVFRIDFWRNGNIRNCNVSS